MLALALAVAIGASLAAPAPVAAEETVVVTSQAIVDAPIQEVWRAWTTRDGAEESQKMRAFFERGNQATLDSLVKRFAHSAH